MVKKLFSGQCFVLHKGKRCIEKLKIKVDAQFPYMILIWIFLVSQRINYPAYINKIRRENATAITILKYNVLGSDRARISWSIASQYKPLCQIFSWDCRNSLTKPLYRQMKYLNHWGVPHHWWCQLIYYLKSPYCFVWKWRGLNLIPIRSHNINNHKITNSHSIIIFRRSKSKQRFYAGIVITNIHPQLIPYFY